VAVAGRCLIENREAAIGVQMFHMRQRCWGGCGVAGANAGPPWWLVGWSVLYRGGERPTGVAPCSGHGGGDQLLVARQWISRRWGA
jgi:hypothetical protein